MTSIHLTPVWLYVIFFGFRPNLTTVCCLISQVFCFVLFYRAVLHSADYAVARCPSVRLSVRHTPVFCLNGYIILKVFVPSGSTTIVVFPHQTGWQYFDGDPRNRGRRMQVEYEKK